MLLLAGLASALYLPGISGAATSPRWAVLAIVPWLLKWQGATIAHWIGGLFLAWAVLTMAWNPAPLDGIGALFFWLICGACFCLGDQQFDLRKVWIGAALGIGLSSIAAIAQFFGFRGINGLMPIHGLFVNENYMTEAAALVLVALIGERLWWWVPAVLPALLLGQGRGGLVAVAVPFLIKYRKNVWMLAAVAMAVIAAVAYVTVLKAQPASTPERLTIWWSALHGVNLFGHGIGSFWTQYPQFDLRAAPISMPETAHNEFITMAFELGVVGLVLALAFLVCLIGPLNTPRMVLIALLTESCFAFPLHLPTTAFLGMVAAGHAVWDSYLVRDLPDVRRNLSRLLRAAAGRAGSAQAYLGRAPHALRSSLPRISSNQGAL